MAIAYGSSVDGGRGSGTSMTFAFNNVSGDCVVVYARNTNGASPSGVTYAGVAMTLVVSADNGADHRHNLYVLTSPATGSNNVVISYAAGQGFIDAMAASYTGVNQASPTGTTDNTDTASGTTTFAPALTTGTDNSWVVAAIGNSTGDATAGANTAERIGNANGNSLMDSNAAVSPAGARTLNASRASNSNWTSALFELKVATATTAVKDIIGNGFIPFAR